MLWLYILLGILLAIFLILLIPIGIDTRYEDELFLKLKIGFAKITVFPQKPKKPKKKKKKKQKPKDDKPKEDKPKEKKPNIIQQKGLSWLVEFIKKIAELASGALKYFFAHILIKRMMLSISIAGSDAADTALKYGKLCAVVYPAIGIIAGSAKCRKFGVDITPNFTDKAETKFYFELKASVRIIWLIALLLKFGPKGIRLLLEIRN